jgi:uncharacterized damage-inducible protein DinB
MHHLAEGFDYDLWANRAWLQHLISQGSPEPEVAALQHLLGAQKIWLLRLSGTSVAAMPRPELSEATLVELHDGWVSAIKHGQDRVIAYRRMNGEESSNSLAQIAQHVINHGTYHRGEMRGLCRSRGDEDFPETDWIRFVAVAK